MGEAWEPTVCGSWGILDWTVLSFFQRVFCGMHSISLIALSQVCVYRSLWNKKRMCLSQEWNSLLLGGCFVHRFLQSTREALRSGRSNVPRQVSCLISDGVSLQSLHAAVATFYRIRSAVPRDNLDCTLYFETTLYIDTLRCDCTLKPSCILIISDVTVLWKHSV